MTDQQIAPRRRAYGMKAAEDALSHDNEAKRIYKYIMGLPRSSVVSVQGPWGRGKTDVMTRVFELFMKDAQDHDRQAPEPIWIDPWKYGRPNLIQPVVVELLDRTRGRRGDKGQLRAVATSLLHAGNAMMFKAVSVFVPFGSIVEAAQDPVDKLIDDLMQPGAQRSNPDADPVREMAERFRELVDEVLSLEGLDIKSSQRLVICVDDLDRCLPDHQIAMLEAIYFLTTADANCSFLVALDPLLVQQAAITHYRTDGFDSDQYLDKLFDLRLNLTALKISGIGGLVSDQLKTNVSGPDGTQTAASVLRAGLGADPDAVIAAFERTFFVPELRNPRLIHRVFQRLRLAAAANVSEPHPQLLDPAVLDDLVAWCAISERWPQFRGVLQGLDNDLWRMNLVAICGFYDIWASEEDGKKSWAMIDLDERPGVLKDARNILSRLPGPSRQPDLGSFVFERVIPGEDAAGDGFDVTLRAIDDLLVEFGL
jgi:hypothetical protein